MGSVDAHIPNRYAESQKSPNGPGDARPTGIEILEHNGLIGKWNDKVILVTGGTSGLGHETVRVLLKTGAKVFFTARDASKAEKTQSALLKGQPDARVDWVKMDNTSLKSVREGADDFLKRTDKLNILINNAGIANTPQFTTEDGHEGQFQTNHLAHVLLFTLLMPLLLKSSTPSFNSRVVNVSSNAHQFSTVLVGDYNFEKASYDPFVAYGQSKTANIWLANEIERRYGSRGLHGLSLHPGIIMTEGFKKLDPTIMEHFKPLLEQEVFQKAFKSVEQGAATQVYAAVDKDLEGKGGLFLEDAALSPALPADAPVPAFPGYLPHAFDEEGAKKLWADSHKILGLDESV